jgi:hypothetical protein
MSLDTAPISQANKPLSKYCTNSIVFKPFGKQVWFHDSKTNQGIGQLSDLVVDNHDNLGPVSFQSHCWLLCRCSGIASPGHAMWSCWRWKYLKRQGVKG